MKCVSRNTRDCSPIADQASFWEALLCLSPGAGDVDGGV